MDDSEDPRDLAFVYGPGTAPAGSRVALVFDQIVARIEPITRFDRTSLSQVRAYDRIAAGSARWKSSIAIGIQNRSGPGALPAGVVVVNGSNALGSESEAAVHAAWSEMPERIGQWLEQNGNSLQELTAPDCYAGPSIFGHQYRCDTCGGRGQTQCGQCHGKGDNTCTQCQGKGKQGCSQCHGQGTYACSGCGGRGNNTVQQQRQVFNSNTNSYDTEYYTQQQTCLSCGGSGKHICSGCGGDGETTCTWCQGSGRQRCSGCGGSGQKQCGNCSGTGQRHEIREIICHVTDRYNLVVDDSSEEVMTRLRGLTLAQLCELGTVTVDQPDRGADYLERRYQWTVNVAEVWVGVADREVVVTGFGANAQVHDFQNIAGLLLEGDLEQLTSQIGREPRVSTKLSPLLRTAVAQCLESEANITIGTARARDPKALKALMSKQFAGALSPEYAHTLASSLRTALGRLYFPAMLWPAAAVMVLPAVLFLISQLTEWGTRNVAPSAGIALLAGVVAWMITERAVRKRLTGGFGPVQAAIVERLLAAQGMVARWRWAGAVVAGGLVGLIIKLT